MASLSFLGKYDVMLILWSFCQTIFDSMLCSDNVDCVTCFSLTQQCSFICLPVSPMYLPARIRYFVAPAELSGDLWSLRLLKICPIFLDGLKIVRILCLFNILLIWSAVPLTYGRMDRILLSGCVSKTVVLFAYLFYDCFVFSYYVFSVTSVFL